MREKMENIKTDSVSLSGKLKTRRTAFFQVYFNSNESAIRNARRNHSCLLCGHDVAICSLKDFSFPV